MNETDLLAQLIGKDPAMWLKDGTSIAVLLMIAGRVWHCVTSGGGLVGIWKALLFGTNVPKEKKVDQ